MENTIDSLTYKGSIPEAINQSRREKKLFVIYISGEDETSSRMEQSTLVDEHVAGVISRCCIFLQLKHGNVDALQFSAIYPQKSIPSVSVVGLNGAMLWNHEGYISPEDLKESIEKAWAALHLQETAATLLAASLASRMADPANTASTNMPSTESSSTSEDHSNSPSQFPESSSVRGSANSTELVAQPPSSITQAELLKTSESSKSDSTPCNITTEEKLDSARKAVLPEFSASSNMHSCTDPNQTGSTPPLKGKNKVGEISTAVPSEPAASIITGRSTSSELLVEQDKATTSSAVDVTSDSANKDDIQLVIRIPNGPSLQIKLTKEDVLRKVKNFVDENKGSAIGSYNLAMLYPRKVFTEQDMETSLYELGIETRQALVVVPNPQSVKVARHQSSSPSSDLDHIVDSDNSGGWGYFGILGTALSYVNPLSYLRGNPEQLGNEGSQHYRQSSPSSSRLGMGAASESQPLSSNGSQQAATHSSGNTLRRRPRQFGSNIHTLSSEEQGPSDDRNVFWNGNSTEYGGDEKK
ncbi:plant UBX domain-containing protein 11-like [Lolium rigidum]|uniref:plant UBX domain-containing protein 11-like n=1 Tax=Lolium rigidum TaxID=89674 RepID=UPI001F5CB8C8|nr:plant UBX domain-containing protein 11-like [Lolium rigidum]XP_047091848.1 plant UBX domain-containing protein 11-like [Lolium rigidum]